MLFVNNIDRNNIPMLANAGRSGERFRFRASFEVGSKAPVSERYTLSLLTYICPFLR